MRQTVDNNRMSPERMAKIQRQVDSAEWEYEYIRDVDGWVEENISDLLSALRSAYQREDAMAAELAAVTRERDAAVTDALRFGGCKACKNNNICPGAIDCDAPSGAGSEGEHV